MSSAKDFLNSPKVVAASEAEKKKHDLRKAKLAADHAQQAIDPENPPSVEDMLADIIRVAEDKLTNPLGYKLKSTSAQRQRKWGHIPLSLIEAYFGTFSYALEVSGLRHEAGTKTKNKAREIQARKEHTARYVEEYVAPYALHSARYADTLRHINNETETNYRILIISDMHATFTDPWTLLCFLKAAKHIEPDCLYFNGDIFEGSAISRHPKIPGWNISFKLECEFVRDLFALVRSHFPDTTIVWGAGNHGVDRVASYLSHTNSALAGLPTTRIDKLVDLDGLDIILAQQGTIASPDTQEDVMEQGTVFFGQYRLTHGTKLGQMPAMAELKQYMMSGSSGHIHRSSIAHISTAEDPDLNWMSTGMGCSPRAGRAYMKGAPPFGWQQGIGLATLSPISRRVQQESIITSGGVAMVHGLTLVKPADFPEEPPASTNWLPTFDFKV